MKRGCPIKCLIACLEQRILSPKIHPYFENIFVFILNFRFYLRKSENSSLRYHAASNMLMIRCRASSAL